MKIQCEYCGSFISDTDEKCPYCGATNEHLVTSAAGIPKTISELISFCNSHHIPYEKMRFFLGRDFREPKAFGIYQDADGDFVVYKNKADGSRIVRYKGKDEAYAVNEIYQKMRSEVSERKEQHPENITPPNASKQLGNRRRKNQVKGYCIFLTILILIMVMPVIKTGMRLAKFPRNGYYNYNNELYYNQNGNWYIFNNDWEPTYADSELKENYKDYWEGADYENEYHAEDFEDSEYYTSDSDTEKDTWEDNSWEDDDWDYDYDSWDSNDTDWDSDW